MQRKILLIICVLNINTCLHAQGSWTQIADYGGGAVTEARAFSIGTIGYIVATPDLWQYDPATLVWTQMASFPGVIRLSGAAFSIGSKGYFGTGGTLNDFYEYDQASNTWTLRTNFGGTGREGAVGISINGKGYIGLGGNYLNDWWEYDTTSNAWTQKANMGGPGRYHAGAFTIDNFGYVCCGFNGSFFNDLWQYDPTGNTWTAKTNMPGITRDRPVGLSANGKGYIICGWSGTMTINDAWEYDPSGNAWTAIANYGGVGRYNHCGFVAAGSLYVGTGYASGTLADVWKYTNACTVIAAATTTTCSNSCDGTATVTQPDSNAVATYLWNSVPVQTTPTAINLCSGNYIVTVTDTSGCTSSVTVTIASPPPIVPVITSTPVLCNGGASGTICAPAGYNCYNWSNGSTTQCLSVISAGTYSVTVCDASGCTGSGSGVVTEPPVINIGVAETDASCQTCANGTATAIVNGGVPPYTYNWSNGNSGNPIQNLLPGWYTCCVSDVNGCTMCDSALVNYANSVNHLINSTFSITPNPFNDFIFIEDIDEFISHSSIKLTDVSGNEVRVKITFEKQGIKINTSNLKAGLYFIEIFNSDKELRFKVLKNQVR